MRCSARLGLALSVAFVLHAPVFAFQTRVITLPTIPLVPRQTPAVSAPMAALNEGRANDAIQLLKINLASDPRDAAAHLLLCRVFYAQESFNPAIRECEAAVASAPSDSASYLWLGRAYGMKASQANPLVAFGLARKTVAAFERAVALDPASVAAMRDLGEYYVNAPSIVGGGMDKARALAAKLMLVSATKGHRLLGEIAEKQGDYVAAEAEFRRAVDAHPAPDSYVDLAQYFLGRKQFDRITDPIQSAVRLDHSHDNTIVDAAAILISAGQSSPLAEQLLRAYLASPAKSDGAPAFKVHLQLGDLLLKRGDRAGALQEYDAAIGLASNYAPAKLARAQAFRQTASQAGPQAPGPQAPGVNAIP